MESPPERPADCRPPHRLDAYVTFAAPGEPAAGGEAYGIPW